MLRSVAVVGIGADGWVGLSPAGRARIGAAPVVIGGARHLALLPSVPGQVRTAWPSPFSLAAVDHAIDRAVDPVLDDGSAGSLAGSAVVLASGDPLVSGVATTLIDRYGARCVEVLPAVSSVALARARMGWSAESVEVLTVVGRALDVVRRQLAPGRRLLVLSSDETTPALLAALLVDAGCGTSAMTVLGDLGAAQESRFGGVADSWSGDAPRLNVVAIQVGGAASATWAPGVPDAAYEHDGQLTKRDLRVSALARLRPQPGQLLWDVGAGAGSVGIEWLRAHPTCRAIAVEQHPERVARIARNASALGVPDLIVVTGAAPGVLTGLEAPDAVFVGGGATVPELIETCRARLRPGGRLVVHGVTVETEMMLAAAYAEHGGELSRHSVEHAEPLGTFTGWTPARAVTQWSWEKQGTGEMQ